MNRFTVCIVLVMLCACDTSDAPSPTGPGTATATPAPTPAPTARGNRPPTVDIIDVQPSRGLMRVTRMAFAATGVDPDGDAVTLTWNFDDGSPTETGGGVAHIFDTKGTFDVSVTASDGRGGTQKAVRRVTTETITGRWFGLVTNGPNGGKRIGGDIVQTGARFETPMVGNSGDGTGNSFSVFASGILRDPQDVVITLSGICETGSLTFRGSLNDSYDQITAESGGCPLNWRRLELYR